MNYINSIAIYWFIGWNHQSFKRHWVKSQSQSLTFNLKGTFRYQVMHYFKNTRIIDTHLSVKLHG